MPLFRSHSSSSADSAPHRSDLDRQIGCIAGFFHIFDQHSRKQIAGPQKELQHPPSAESYPFTDPVAKEEVSNLANLSVNSKVAASDDTCLSDTLTNAHACSATQSGLVKDGCSSHPSREKNLHQERSFNVREDHLEVNAMVRHGSLNYKQDHREDDISFSPRRAHIGAYAAGGRRFTSKETDTQARFVIDTHDDSGGMQFWSSPASHWPSEQESSQDIAAEGMKTGWLLKGGRDRAWATEDTLEDWKQSLRALVRLREDGQTGVPNNRGSCAVTQSSPRVVRNGPSASPARASAFDFKDAIRWSQRVSFQTEGSRRSLDDRDLPRSIAELRDAMNARSRLLSAASLPPSPRTPSVVARLMGLEDLPKPTTAEPIAFANHHNRKRSGEAKLLQQLLQYSPPTPPSVTHSPLPACHTTSSTRREGQGSCIASSADNSIFSSKHRKPQMRTEVPSELGNLESMTHTSSINASIAKHANNYFNHAKTHDASRHMGSTWEGATEQCLLQAATFKTNNQPSLQVVSNQGDDIRSPSPPSNYSCQDEIERRLRQLGLQSSEQERKTLKQILEGMQVKGLLQSPKGSHISNEAKRQQASCPANLSPVLAPSNGTESWPYPMSKSATQSKFSATRPAKNETGASIVIMRPVAKSVSRVAVTGADRKSGNEKAVTASLRTEKSTQQWKPKNVISPEANSMKDSAGHQPKSRSTASKLHSPAPTRKVSLRIRPSQIHVSKGLNQAMPSGHARRSGSDAPTRRQEHTPSRCSAEHMIMNVCSNASEDCTSIEANHAHSLYIHAIDTTLDVAKQPKCKLGSSGASLDVDTLEHVQVISIKEGGGRTPPRKSMGEHNFGVNGDCCGKEVIHEQCSPVSVLDPHISEDDESSPASESIRVLTDFQEDSNRRSLSVEELQFSLQESEDIEATQPVLKKASYRGTVTDFIDDSFARDEDFLEPTKDALQVTQDKQGQACENSAYLLLQENVLHDDIGCACDSSCVQNVVERPNECPDRSRACERMKEAYANKDNSIHMDTTLWSMEDSVCMEDDSVCARDIMHLSNACVSTGDDVCGSQELHADLECLNNADFCYTEDVLKTAGLTGTWARGTCTADVWLACGGKMCRKVFDELEERWDARNPEEEGGNLKSEDRDMGGELYWKSQQASMRRRLVFDCLNEVVEGRLSWLGLPGTCSTRTHGHLPVSMVWGDLQRLELGPSSAEDSMYAMLEQDLLHDADYSATSCWSGTPTQLADVALQLEGDIFDALVSEILPQPPL